MAAAGFREKTPLMPPEMPVPWETVRPDGACTVTPSRGWEVVVVTD